MNKLAAVLSACAVAVLLLAGRTIVLDETRTGLAPCSMVCRIAPASWRATSRCQARQVDGGMVGDPYEVPGAGSTPGAAIQAAADACTASVQ